MRKDFSKLLTERERYASSSGYRTIRRKQKKADLEYQGMRKPYRRGLNRKEFSDNLSPLYRFLEKSVGRKWDKIYSELREHISVKKQTDLHILQHLWDFVERPGTIKPRYYRISAFYIDNSGIFRKTVPSRHHSRFRRYPKEKEEITNLRASNTSQYRKEEGIWYLYKEIEVTKTKKVCLYFGNVTDWRDNLVKEYVTQIWFTDYKAIELYKIKQLNKKELKVVRSLLKQYE